MATQNTPIDVNMPANIDSRYGKQVAGKTVPYASVAEANAGTPDVFRYEGQLRLISISGVPKLYWYSGGTADGNLVPATDTEQKLDIIIGSGSGYIVSGGSTILTVASLIGKTITSLKIEGLEIPSLSRTSSSWYAFDSSTGVFTLTNGTFTDEAYVAIKFK